MESEFNGPEAKDSSSNSAVATSLLDKLQAPRPSDFAEIIGSILQEELIHS